MPLLRKAALVLTPLIILGSLSPLAAAEETAQSTITGWFEQSDCKLSFDRVVDLSLSAQGFAPIDLKAAMDELVEDGSVRRDVDENFVLVTGERCAGTEVAEPEILAGTAEAVLVAIMELNGCEMVPRAIFEAALAQGLTRADIDEAGEGLFDQGALAPGENGLKLVTGSVCGK